MLESQLILPTWLVRFSGDIHRDCDVRISSRGKASDSRNTATPPDRFLKASANRNYIPEEAECVEEIAFSGCVRSNDEDTALKRDIDRREVSPVRQPQVSNREGLVSSPGSRRHKVFPVSSPLPHPHLL